METNENPDAVSVTVDPQPLRRNQRVIDPIEYRRHVMFNLNNQGRGGICVYAWHNSHDSWVNFTTAVCSNNDVYSKKVANHMIQENIRNGVSIRLPLPIGMNRHLLSTKQLYAIMDAFFAPMTVQDDYDDFGIR